MISDRKAVLRAAERTAAVSVVVCLCAACLAQWSDRATGVFEFLAIAMWVPLMFSFGLACMLMGELAKASWPGKITREDGDGLSVQEIRRLVHRTALTLVA